MNPAHARVSGYNAQPMSHLDLAVLGAGNMGRALIGGLLRQGTRPSASPWASLRRRRVRRSSASSA